MGSIGVSIEWPEDPTDLNGWISYAISLAIFPLFLILLALAAPCAFGIVCCCRKYGKCGALPTDSSDYSLKERAIAAAVTSLAVGIIIGATICLGVIAPMIRDDVRNSVSTVTYAARGVAGFVEDFDKSLDSLGGVILSTVNETLNETRQFPIEQFIFKTFEIQGSINQTQYEVLNIRSETLQVDAVLELLRNNMFEVEQGQRNGSMPNFAIPDAFSFDATAETDPTLNSIDEGLVAAVDRMSSLREQVLSIYLSLTTQSSIDITPIIQRIDDIQNSFRGQLASITQVIDGTVDEINSVRSTVTTVDNIRMWALLGILGANFLLICSFYLFFFAKENRLLKIPLISISVFVVLFFLITAVYFVVWKANKDVCEKVEPYLQKDTVQGSLKRLLMTDSTAFVRAGFNTTVDMEPSGNTTVQSPIDKVFEELLSDPMPLLYCSHETTIMQLYNLDLLDIFGLADILNATMTSGIRTFSSQMDQQNDIADALVQLNNLQSGLEEMRGVLGAYTTNSTQVLALVANATIQVADLTQYGYNQTAHDELMSSINAVTVPYDLFYTIYNVSALDANDPTFSGLTPEERDNLQQNRDKAVAMTQYRLDVEANIQPTLDLLHNMTGNLQLLLGHFANINGSLQAIMATKDTLVTQLTELQREVMANLQLIYLALDAVIDNVHDKTTRLEFGRCAWLGAFWAGGDPDNTGTASLHEQFCDSFAVHLTLSTWALFLLALAMVAAWALMIKYRNVLKKPKVEPELGGKVPVNPFFMQPSSSAGQLAGTPVWAPNPFYSARTSAYLNPSYSVKMTVISADRSIVHITSPGKYPDDESEYKDTPRESTLVESAREETPREALPESTSSDQTPSESTSESAPPASTLSEEKPSESTPREEMPRDSTSSESTPRESTPREEKDTAQD